MTHKISVDVDWDVWRRAMWYSGIMDVPMYVIVEQGIRCKMNDAADKWPVEMSEIPEDFLPKPEKGE